MDFGTEKDISLETSDGGSGSYDPTKAAADYRPDLTLKRPNRLQKVTILEEVVLKGTAEDLKAVLSTYQPFELTARALGLAGRYRGLEFVRILVEHGADFRYTLTPSLKRNYVLQQKTVGGYYRTLYYLMIIPKTLLIHPQGPFRIYMYDYTPMFGVGCMDISDEQEAKALPLADRLEVARYLLTHQTGASMDEMLFWSLTNAELEFADALMEMGANLSTAPSYYDSNTSEWYVDENDELQPVKETPPAYLDMITGGKKSLYWDSYRGSLLRLDEQQLLPVLERFHALAAGAGKKLVLTQTMFEEMRWTEASVTFAVTHMDVTRVNKRKAMELAVDRGYMDALNQMVTAGWLKQPAKRDDLIAFAQTNQKSEALAWLLDYKNRTADPVAEAAKAEAKMRKALMTEDPCSAAALKKIWGYEKKADGSLVITSYKGNETAVVVPAYIGRSPVTAIDRATFSTAVWAHARNWQVRKYLRCVVISEGIKEIGPNVFFSSQALRHVYIPDSVTQFGERIFGTYDEDQNWYIVTGICVHTRPGAPVLEYLKHYSGIKVVFDYDTVYDTGYDTEDGSVC